MWRQRADATHVGRTWCVVVKRCADRCADRCIDYSELYIFGRLRKVCGNSATPARVICDTKPVTLDILYGSKQQQ